MADRVSRPASRRQFEEALNRKGRINSSACGLARFENELYLRDFLPQRRRQVDLVLLLLDEDAADVLGDRVLAERLALPHPLAIVADGLGLVVEIELEHLFGSVRGPDRLRLDRR